MAPLSICSIGKKLTSGLNGPFCYFSHQIFCELNDFNAVALRMAQTLLSFGCLECNRVNSIENVSDFQILPR